MVRALRVVTVERGIDPRRFTLLPFGGAGPMHAAAIAEELGIARIACPRASGVLSALGLIAAGRRRDTARTVLLAGEQITADRVADEVAALATRAGEGLDGAGLEVVYELRYAGQAFELPIDGPPEPDPAELREAFEGEHEARYGYSDPGAELELVGIRVAAAVPGPELRPRAAAGEGFERGEREAVFGGAAHATAVLRGSRPRGSRRRARASSSSPRRPSSSGPAGARASMRAGTIDARRGRRRR